VVNDNEKLLSKFEHGNVFSVMQGGHDSSGSDTTESQSQMPPAKPPAGYSLTVNYFIEVAACSLLL
jgi:hypothetical protein